MQGKNGEYASYIQAKRVVVSGVWLHKAKPFVHVY